MPSNKVRRSRWVRNRDERGAVLVVTAISMVMLLWAGAMGVDIGLTVVGSRQAQAMADTAALDMARYINLANDQSQAANYLPGKLSNVTAENGASNVTLGLTAGYWSSSGGFTTPPVGGGCYYQFPAHNPPCTAVMITASQNVPQVFVGGAHTVSRQAVAAITPEDGFSIGTYLANLNTQQTGVLNAILSTLGLSANITAVGYEGLANSYVTLQQLITASGGILTPSNVLTQNISAGQLLSWLTIALNTQQSGSNCGGTPVPSVCSAYSALLPLDFGSATTQLCHLVSINGSSCGSGNPLVSNEDLPKPGLSANLDVLQILTTDAEAANGTGALNVQSALGITGVSAATLSLNLINPPQIAYGPVGTKATTAQVSADLQLIVAGQVLDIPITAAEGTASLTTVTCSEQNNSFLSAVVTASTTTATAALSLAGSSIGTLTISGAGSTALQFNSTVVPPTASTASPTPPTPPTNPIQLGTTAPTLSWTGLSILSPVYALLTSTLPGVLGPILQAAGLSVGGANVADLNYNCGAVSIVK
jgi:uncharacterized membrane protein